MERMIEIGSGRSWVSMAWRFIGRDLSVTVTGGEAPHIGAVALAFRQDGAIAVSSLTVPQHREDTLARACAEALCRTAGYTTLVSCGIHIGEAAPQEIDLICTHVKCLTRKLQEILGT